MRGKHRKNKRRKNQFLKSIRTLGILFLILVAVGAGAAFFLKTLKKRSAYWDEESVYSENSVSEERSSGETSDEKTYPYWIVFNEGFRESRIELSTVESSLPADQLYIVWDGSLKLSDTAGSGTCSQYYLDDGEWVYEREYHRLSDWATDIIASNLDVYDGDGNLVMEASPDSALDELQLE